MDFPACCCCVCYRVFALTSLFLHSAGKDDRGCSALSDYSPSVPSIRRCLESTPTPYYIVLALSLSFLSLCHIHSSASDCCCCSVPPVSSLHIPADQARTRHPAIPHQASPRGGLPLKKASVRIASAPAQHSAAVMDPASLRRKDTTKGPPLRILSLGTFCPSLSHPPTNSG